MSSDQISLSSALSARLTLLGVDIERVGQLAGLPGCSASGARRSSCLPGSFSISGAPSPG
ncbi:Uncharacterised protein [Serratia entomophila]|nr:Uncharacterised protein [Serratia entomophila]CAI0982319.1 Uncharacterised protein [Serratia entomophila]CAI2112087.1 Uncharacterised protein [Serratia entomophila]